MKIKLGHIKIFVLLLLVSFLFAFSNGRNNNRVNANPEVKFIGEDNLFLTHEDVSKLLIQNPLGLNNATKDIIDLNQLEIDLNSNPMVKNAEVYMSVNGVLKTEIKQKTPIARVHTNASYYIDNEGAFMPLSNNYSARVPLVTGLVYKNKLEQVFKIAKFINEDEFLKQNVIEINQSEKDEITLRFRLYKFKLELGDLNNLEKKTSNFKVFCIKAMKDKKINTYSKVSLRFENQVICTKK